MAPAMALALAANFGSVERWRDGFTAMARARAGASGALLLSFQAGSGTLAHQQVAGLAHAVGCQGSLLAFELDGHAVREDNGARADARIDAFMRNIDWDGVHGRYQLAVHAATGALAAEPSRVAGTLLFDVRRAGVFEQAGEIIPGAAWRDPVTVGKWARELPRDREVVVYCVHGHEVSRATALRLRSQGVDARFLRGGIDGWKAAGMPLAARQGACAAGGRPQAPFTSEKCPQPISGACSLLSK
jgi:Fe-Mn family superoxide dismutase